MQCDTKKKILDHAERLFADKGVRATSIRELAHAAEVNIASVNYHFGSKDGLAKQVIERRLVPLNQVRQERLKMILSVAEEEGRRPEIEDLLRALIEPTFEFSACLSNSQSFLELISMATNGTDSQLKEIIDQQFELLFQLIDTATQRALPQLPPQELRCRLYFAMGALHSSIRLIGKKGPALFPISDSLDISVVTEMALNFIASGLQAPSIKG
jgi:AcrR family transcriptional regulator